MLTPETVVVAEARRSLTTLSLYGYRVDGVIANRVFPAGGGDAWRAGWVAAQRDMLAEVGESFPAVPVWHSSYRPASRSAPTRCAAFAAATYGGDDPLAAPTATGR